MRNRVELRCVLNALDQIVGQITGRTACTVSDADKVGHVRFEFANRLVKRLGRPWCFRRKKLERKGGGIAPHDVGNVHKLGEPSLLPRLSVNSPTTHFRACIHPGPQIQGTMANTRAGNPEPPFGFGKLATTIAPASGTWSRFVRSSI